MPNNMHCAQHINGLKWLRNASNLLDAGVRVSILPNFECQRERKVVEIYLNHNSDFILK